MPSTLFAALEELGHEQVIHCHDSAAGYRAIIAIHSTALGPAVGGTRYWPYANEADALQDALRLARGMTYKNALAGLALGGGKAVILKDGLNDGQATDRERLFRAHGRFIERLGGRFITAEDVGTSVADMHFIHLETSFVAGRRADPSPHTARGVVRGMQAAAQWRWGNQALRCKTVALQGCGNVGSHLASELHQLGARLIVADVNPAAAARVAAEFGATVVAPAIIHTVPADIFAPCALGATLNAATIPALAAEIVAGAANNQLQHTADGARLAARGIFYAPDYAINAGGVISGSVDLLGWTETQAAQQIERIFDTLLNICELAQAERIAPHEAADRLAEQRLRGPAPAAPSLDQVELPL